jgi:hypothetical protein
MAGITSEYGLSIIEWPVLQVTGLSIIECPVLQVTGLSIIECPVLQVTLGCPSLIQ